MWHERRTVFREPIFVRLPSVVLGHIPAPLSAHFHALRGASIPISRDLVFHVIGLVTVGIAVCLSSMLPRRRALQAPEHFRPSLVDYLMRVPRQRRSSQSCPYSHHQTRRIGLRANSTERDSGKPALTTEAEISCTCGRCHASYWRDGNECNNRPYTVWHKHRNCSNKHHQKYTNCMIL